MNEHLMATVRSLALPKPESHKGQNGKLLIIGGSHLFHAASLWSLTVASRIVDLVHYSSVDENNQIVHELKKEFRNGIVIPRDDIERYIQEDDCILIGPGMERVEGDVTQIEYTLGSLKEINEIEHEGILTYHLTKYLLKKYPKKQWVIDAGALQMMDIHNIPNHAILTPHQKEFELLKIKDQGLKIKDSNKPSNTYEQKLHESIEEFTRAHNCTVLLKGKKDIASNGKEIQVIEGGNAGMTKGGTGDVLAGLIAALACTNDPWSATLAGSFINKRAGDELFDRVGPFFNASDLAEQIPITMKKLMDTR